MGLDAPLTAQELSDHMEQQRRRGPATLVMCAAAVPAELELADFQWLHEREDASYVPPWRQPEAAPQPQGRIIEPTVHTRFPESIPDSCPVSPIYAEEVPDSDSDVIL